MRTRRRTQKKPLWLTGEETGRLLALVIASPMQMGEMEERVMHKLGYLCRAFLREEAAQEAAKSAPEPRMRPARRLPQLRSRLMRGQRGLVAQASGGIADG